MVAFACFIVIRTGTLPSDPQFTASLGLYGELNAVGANGIQIELKENVNQGIDPNIYFEVYRGVDLVGPGIRMKKFIDADVSTHSATLPIVSSTSIAIVSMTIILCKHEVMVRRRERYR